MGLDRQISDLPCWTVLVSWTRCGAISAITRVFDALWRCSAEPGPRLDMWTPDQQRIRPKNGALRSIRGTAARASFKFVMRRVRDPCHVVSFWQ